MGLVLGTGEDVNFFTLKELAYLTAKLDLVLMKSNVNTDIHTGSVLTSEDLEAADGALTVISDILTSPTIVVLDLINILF